MKTKIARRLGIGDLALDGVALVSGRCVSVRFSAISRRRKDFDDEIQDRVAADIVQGGTQQHGKDLLVANFLVQTLPQILGWKRAFLEEFLHQLVFAFGNQFHQRFMRCLRLVGHVGWNFLDFRFAVAIGRVDQRLHRHQVDHAPETLLRADRQLNWNHAAAEHLLQRVERALEARKLAIHPVDDEGARLIVFRCVVPNFFGHHLHARGRVHQNQRRVGGNQR